MSNWDTEELERWIMNDEGLYRYALDYARQPVDEVAEAISTVVGGQIAIDYAKIDWSYIATSIDDAAREENS